MFFSVFPFLFFFFFFFFLMGRKMALESKCMQQLLLQPFLAQNPDLERREKYSREMHAHTGTRIDFKS